MARYLDQAAEGFFRFLLGREVAEILATAFAQPGHDLSYQYVTFAEREDRIVGLVSGFTAEEHARGGGSKRLALDVAAKNEAARRLHERRGMAVESQWPTSFLPRGFIRMTKAL